jgi:signal transduction histidine kinase
VIDDVRDILELQARLKKIDLIIEFNLPDSTKIFSDAKRLKQVLFNLVGNALKFTFHGQIKIDVQLKQISLDDIDPNYEV